MFVTFNFQKVKLVYASSSSVYGKESPIPFKLSAYTDRPGNMYAATKKTDELLGKYHFLMNRPSVCSVCLRLWSKVKLS